MSTSKQARILQSINDFFAVECSRQKPQPCSRCGCLMQLFEGHFWLYGTEMRWNMPVPFCSDCDGDVRAFASAYIH